MIFVDAGVFYARLAEDDQNHEVANLFFHGLGLTVPLITTNAVIYEAHALLLRLSRFPSIAVSTSPARGFLEEVDAGLCEVEHVNPDDHQVARRLIDRNRDKSYSYCDALSFVVMERLGIEVAASFDRHFRQYGKFTVFP